MRLPVAVEGPARLAIRTEDGRTIEQETDLAALASRPPKAVAGEAFRVLDWPLPADLPAGYHHLTLRLTGSTHHAHLFVTPERCWQPSQTGDRRWGVFIPLYALRMDEGLGTADWTDFRRLTEWIEARGGDVVATLPMFAGYLGDGGEGGPFEYSPYAPATRLFLNELFIDLDAVPELEAAAEARALMASPEFRAEAAELEALPRVDYRRAMALKRRVLEILSRHFFDRGKPDRRAAFDDFLRERPDTREYALFRAAIERTRTTWHVWPEPMRSGTLTEHDADPQAVQYHLYAQWIAHEQLGALARRPWHAGSGLYLDMPLGVNGDSYDVWRHRELFAMEAAGGAPPDNFFIKGQNWGFPPLHPERSRAEGHAYWRMVVSRLTETARALRIDHIMGLHRLYWIPRGMAADEGAYVRYPHDEIYAILAIESNRHACQVCGENLGTVPPAVPEAMERHGIVGMYVMQFSVRAEGERAIDTPPAGTIASINTHDTPTFAGWWAGRDIDIQLETGLITEAQHREAHTWRGWTRDSMIWFLRQRGLLGDSAGVFDMLTACLRLIARSDAGLLLINLEDLWLETEPQNVPGTGPDERPNWRHRAAVPFGQWTANDDIARLLDEIDRLRRSPGGRTASEAAD